MDIGVMKPATTFFKMRLLVLLLIGGASVLASHQQLREEPALPLNNRVPRDLETTDDDDTENEAFKAQYAHRIIKLIEELKEEIDKHLVREKGIDVMTTIFEKTVKSDSENEWFSDESTESDSDDDEAVNIGLNVTNEIVTGVSKLLNKYGPKNLNLNWVLNIIHEALYSVFDVSPTDLACFERNILNVINEVETAYSLYLFNSECRVKLSEYMKELYRKKTKVHVIKSNENIHNNDLFKRSPQKSILGRQYKSKAASLVNDLQDDDVYLNEFFEIGLYLKDDSNEFMNKPEEKVEKNINVDLMLHNCEQIASEQFLLSIESSIIKFLLQSNCKSIDETGRGTVKRSIKESLFSGIKDQFKLNSISKIKDKLNALNLSPSMKMIYLPITEQILKAFYVKLPPVIKKVLDEINPRFKKLNLEEQVDKHDTEFIDLTKQRSVRTDLRDSNVPSAIEASLPSVQSIDLRFNPFMEDNNSGSRGWVSISTQNAIEPEPIPWNLINRRK